MGETYNKKSKATDAELETLVKRSQQEALALQLIGAPQVVDLYHYGVLGMRWGVRNRSRSRVSKQTLKKPASNESDHERAVSLKRKSLRHLSNAELKELNARMELEQKYSKLNPTRVGKGHNAVKAMVAAGTLATTAYAFKNSDLAKEVVIPAAKKVARAVRTAAPTAAKAASSKS